MDWTDFLGYLSSPNGIAVAVGIAISWLAEYIPGFKELLPKWKRLVVLGVNLAIPLLAATLGVLTAGWPASWEGTFWPAIVAGALAFGSSTLAHIRLLKRGSEEDA